MEAEAVQVAEVAIVAEAEAVQAVEAVLEAEAVQVAEVAIAAEAEVLVGVLVAEAEVLVGVLVEEAEVLVAGAQVEVLKAESTKNQNTVAFMEAVQGNASQEKTVT